GRSKSTRNGCRVHPIRKHVAEHSATRSCKAVTKIRDRKSAPPPSVPTVPGANRRGRRDFHFDPVVKSPVPVAQRVARHSKREPVAARKKFRRRKMQTIGMLLR